MDEMIDIVRGLLTGDYFEYHGEIFDVPAIKICPAPDRAGARSSSAATASRRCAGPPARRRLDARRRRPGAELPGLLERLARATRREYGREREPVRGPRDLARRLHAPTASAGSRTLGVTDVIVGFRWTYVSWAGHRVPADQDRQPAALRRRGDRHVPLGAAGQGSMSMRRVRPTVSNTFCVIGAGDRTVSRWPLSAQSR